METLTQEEISQLKKFFIHSMRDLGFNPNTNAHFNTKVYDGLTAEEKSIFTPEAFAAICEWACLSDTDFELGDVVRAKRDLDPEGAAVKKGDLGSVIGEPFHDGDNPHPLIQWFRALPQGVVLGGVCNARPEFLEQVFRPE